MKMVISEHLEVIGDRSDTEKMGSEGIAMIGTIDKPDAFSAGAGLKEI
jgi:hypothetical protein